MYCGPTVLLLSQLQEKTPFLLMYGVEMAIQVEIEEFSWNTYNPLTP